MDHEEINAVPARQGPMTDLRKCVEDWPWCLDLAASILEKAFNKPVTTSEIIYIHESTNIGNPNEVKEKTESAIKYILEEIANKSGQYYIVLALPSEAFDFNFLKFTDAFVKKLVLEYKINYNDIVYLTGASDTVNNRKLYYDYCIKNNYLPTQIVYHNYFEYLQCKYANRDAHIEEIEFNSNPNSTKKFLFLNGVARPHRLFLLGELIKRDLLELSYYSMVDTPQSIYQYQYEPISNFSKMIKEYVSTIQDRLPINLSLKQDLSNMGKVTKEDEVFYQTSLFSLISETLFLSNMDTSTLNYRLATWCYPCHFVTEKTWKPIKAKHPFIVASTPYFLRELRELGYKTFSPYIDESYDLIENDEQRIYAIVDEVERLCKMNETETQEWLNNVERICDYNYRLLKRRGFQAK